MKIEEAVENARGKTLETLVLNTQRQQAGTWDNEATADAWELARRASDFLGLMGPQP
jgi:hypothetical protein